MTALIVEVGPGLSVSFARKLAEAGHGVALAARAAARAEPPDKPDSMLDPDAIAQTMLDLVRQPRSCWTGEIAVRPWVERL